MESDPAKAVEQKDQLKLERRIREEVGRTKILVDALDGAVSRVNAKDLKPYKAQHKATGDPETMVVLRSDLHPGIITPSYNLDVFHRRMQLFTDRIVRIHDIISRTIPIEKIIFINLGDLISGQGIFPNQAWKSEVAVLNQIYHEAAPEIIQQDLTALELVPEIEDHYVPGNHGKTGKENPDESNFDTVVAQDIWRRFEFVDRVKVCPEWGKFMFVDIYGWRFLCTHGNLVRSWMNIPFYGLVNKGMRWKGSLGPTKKDIQQELLRIIREEMSESDKIEAIQKATTNWDYLLHGHFHVPFDFPWNDFEIIGNGCLPSDDDFGIEVLGMSSTPAQQVFGVHPEHGITWRYTLDLS